MNILYETDILRFENAQEDTFLIKKHTGEILMENSFYGNPTCALIDTDNKWAIIAGEHLVIWTAKVIQKIRSEDLKWIHSIRIKNADTVEILTDPWNEKSAIWELDTITFEFKKIRDFDSYKNTKYSDNVFW